MTDQAESERGWHLRQLPSPTARRPYAAGVLNEKNNHPGGHYLLELVLSGSS